MNKLNKIKNFLPKFLKAMKSKDTPKSAKLLGLAAIAYAVMPADIISDFIPVIGLLDDAIVLPFLLYLASTILDKEPTSQKVPVDKSKVIKIEDFEVQ